MNHEYSFCPECGHKLEGDEFLCPSCGFRLVTEAPSVPPVVPPVAEPEVKPLIESAPVIPPPVVNDVPKTEPVAPSLAPPVQPPVVPAPEVQKPQVQTPPQNAAQNPVYQQDMFITNAPKKKKNVGLKIVIILLALIIVGAGTLALLVNQGVIKRDQVSFIPKEILDKIAPKPTAKATPAAPAKAFYYVHTSAVVDGKKVAILSSLMEPANASQSNEIGAENSFNEMARIKYSKEYPQFRKKFVRKFTDKNKALDERNATKEDYKRRGYELRLMEVRY